jgi:hypothetical protein
MELTTHQLDEITEIQHNLNDFELDEAIGQLRPEGLLELRQDCLASIDRQTGILARIQRRL